MVENQYTNIFSDIKWTNAKLNQFVSNYRMSSKRQKSGRYYANLVFNSLKNRGRFSVDRVRNVGSCGKGTALKDSDFDLVVFVNNEYPPFTSVLQSFTSILSNANIPNLENLERNQHSVQFDINGFSFDLLPATDFETADESQFSAAYDYIEDLEDPEEDNYLYSSAMSETVVEFVKRQTQFVKDVIILAKAWNRSIRGMGYISGRSYLIELVAIYANAGKTQNNILTGFVRFLKLMAEFSNIYVGFKDYYNWSCVPEDIKRQRPLILDVTMPWNNLAKKMRFWQMRKFSAAADKMLSRLDDFGYDDFVDVDDLFAPIRLR